MARKKTPDPRPMNRAELADADPGSVGRERFMRVPVPDVLTAPIPQTIGVVIEIRMPVAGLDPSCPEDNGDVRSVIDYAREFGGAEVVQLVTLKD